MVNRIILYLYIPLIIGIIAAVIVLLLRVFRMIGGLAETIDRAAPIAGHLERMNATIEQISQSAQSYKFFLSLAAVFIVIKETVKYWKSEKSISKSFAKALLRHTAQIKGLKF